MKTVNAFRFLKCIFPLTVLFSTFILIEGEIAYGGVFTVTNTNDSGNGSLRQAINGVNFSAGLDTIRFRIPGMGPHIIQPTSVLPDIQESLFIDGYSQPGAIPNSNPFGQGLNSVLMIELDGTNAGNGLDGVRLREDSSIIQGLIIRNFSRAGIVIQSEGNVISGNIVFSNGGDGIQIAASNNSIGDTTAAARNLISGHGGRGIFISQDANNNRIQGNYLGTNVAGTNTLANQLGGIVIFNAAENQIGGMNRGAGNVMSGSVQADGVLIASDDGSAEGNKVLGNRIGTDVAGTKGLENGRHGVWVRDAPNNTIGGTKSGAGNLIAGNVSAGVKISGSMATGNVVQGNLIGIDLTGTENLGNGLQGVLLQNAPNNFIGGTEEGAGNRISGNQGAGIVISEALSTGNLVQGNFVGTDSTGTTGLGNGVDGVRIVDASGSTIGGVLPEARNVISGNGRYGVNIRGGSLGAVKNNVVQGNYIGTDVTGTTPLGNGNSGIFVSGASNTVIDGNVISDNLEGICLDGRAQPTDSTFVKGNLIGLDAAGMIALGNVQDGINITQSSNNFIGGTTAQTRNVISANGQYGIQISSFGQSASGNVIKGNYIGLDASGSQLLPNGSPGLSRGIFIVDAGASGTIIGGSEPEAGNAIAGQDVNIVLSSDNNRVQGNFIGTDISGNPTAGIDRIGVWIIDASHNEIGGSGAGAGNIIAGHGDVGVLIFEASEGSKENIIQQNVITENAINGVRITGGQSINNRISMNSIFDNGALGIELGGDEVSLNDSGDLDTGPNNLQNFPVLVSAVRGNGLTVQGSLGSMPMAKFVIEFFTNTTCDPSNYGEGQRFIGAATVTTNASGDVFFPVPFADVNVNEDYITATATDTLGNTSEFSQCIAIGGSPAAPALISPPNGAADQLNSVTVVWAAPEGAEAYHLQVVTDTAFSMPVFDDSTLTDTTHTITSLRKGRKHYWRVRARNAFGWGGYSPVYSFTTGAPPAAPVLVSPDDEAFGLPSEVNFRWMASDGAKAYHLQVARDENFVSIVLEDSALTDTTKAVTLSEGMKYYWRVRARNRFGWGTYSVLYSFIVGRVPVPPALIAPANAAIDQPDSLIFVWAALEGVEAYHLQVVTDTAFSMPVFDDSTLTDTTHTVTSLRKGRKHYWRVRARNALGWGPYSEVWNFTVGITTSIENRRGEVPKTFILEQNYPNPFNPSTTITYELPQAEQVRITIYDLTGREVRQLVNENQAAGSYTVQWDGKNRNGQTVASGVYIYQMQAGEYRQSRKLLFMK